MKRNKAKFILVMIGAIGMVGGMLAFKANESPNYLYKPAQPGGVCTIRTITYLNITFSNTGSFTELTTKYQERSCPTYITMKN
ncbi:hypothetical protein [Chitinophaga tropicalis]|uniref:Uncharacterized protein n=1 Tax=Chitinophaga tropicalis TaxID=2683588 RepID=A0A7K1UDN9_9BACT|nr:hypothetical protein [Chitinophaga tropicalis]MVT12492.1 hypothetical protein [Chitinophaga tropicalis]